MKVLKFKKKLYLEELFLVNPFKRNMMLLDLANEE